MAAEETTTPTTVDPNPLRGGIRCPECWCPHHSVTNTYQSETSFWGKRREFIRRRRQCERCGNVWYTREVNEPELPEQIKSPEELRLVQEQLRDTMANIIPSKDGSGIDDLPNPFLPEKSP